MASEERKPEHKGTQNSSSDKQPNSNKRILVIGIVLIIAVIVIVGMVVYYLLSKQNNNQTPQTAVVTQLEPTTEDPIEAGYYETSMNYVWNFDDCNTASTDAYVANPDANQNSVYFEIILSDTQETVYTSPVMPRGTQLENIILSPDEPLKAGSYDAVCKYHLVDDDNQEISDLSVTLTLNILN